MTRRPWTSQDIATLRAIYAETPTAAVAEQLGRGVRAVYDKANELRLKKSPHYLLAQRRENVLAAGIATRWAPGTAPWNKGVPYDSGPNSHETRFRPGGTPHNWVPVGTYRINRDGYLDRKVTDKRGGAKDWEAAHRLVWKETHGEIPAGHVVVFRPGRASTVLEDITPDALELVTRQELMRRNTVHRYPEDVKVAIRQLGVFRRKINKRTKHEESDGGPAQSPVCRAGAADGQG